MSGRLSILLRGAAALLAVGASLLIAPAPTADAQSGDQEAVQNYAGCLNGRKVGDLLLLIDESGSLERTDPGGERVTAAKYLLRELSDRAGQAGIRLDVQIAGFATEFDRDPGAWTALTDANIAGLTAEVDGFAARDDGQDTDYWTALDGARRSLAGHRAVDAGEAGRCQAIAWFSDGRLDITATTAQQRQNDGSSAPTTNETAREALCAPRGTAEQLRQAGVWMFGIGLATPGTPADEFDVMRSITTGRADGGGTCGTTTDPAPGTFTPAANIDDLMRAFNDLIGPVDVPGPPTAVCVAADTSCRGQEFVLDGSIDVVDIFGQSDTEIAGLTAELVGPGGERLPLSNTEPGRTTELRLGAATGTYSWQTPRTVDIDLDHEGPPDPAGPAPGWRGVWALRFVAPTATGQSTTNIRVSGNLKPTWKDPKPGLPTGGDQEITLGLQRTDGTDLATLSLPGTYRLGVVLIGPDGRAVPDTARQLADNTTGPVELPLGTVAEGSYTLRLTLDLTTAAARRRDTGEPVPGTTLVQQLVDFPLVVEPPPNYPRVPTKVDFGTGEDRATELTTRLPVSGTGCVWVPAGPGADVATLPTGTESVTVTADTFTSAQNCLSVSDGQPGEVVLHLRADRAGNGAAIGTLPVSIAPTDRPDQARTVTVEFTGDLRSPINPVNFWLALIVALVLGPGIPLGLLYLVKWATARIPARGLYARTIGVTVDDGRTLRDGTPFQFRDGDFVTLADIPPGGARRLVVDDVVLRTRTGRSPFGAGYVSVEPVEGSGLACLAPGDAHPYGYRLTARLPLAVHGTWVVMHDPAGPADQARVLVLVGADTSAPGRARLAADIADRLPAVLERLQTTLAEWGRRGGSAGDGPPPGPPRGGANPAFGPPVHAGSAPAAPGAGPGPRFGPASDPGPGSPSGYPGGTGYGPGPSGGAGQWTPYGPDARSDDTSPLPSGDHADDPDVPQSWQPPRDPHSGPPTYGPRG